MLSLTQAAQEVRPRRQRRVRALAGIVSLILGAAVIGAIAVPGARAAARPHSAPAKGTIIALSGLGQSFGATPSGSGFQFVSHTASENVTSRSIRVEVTGTVLIGASDSGTLVGGELAVCGKKGGKTVNGGVVAPSFTTTTDGEYFAVSASGVLSNLSAGAWKFGLCINGPASGTEFNTAAGTVLLVEG